MFKMKFEFKNRELTDMNYVNAALSGMRLSDLKVEDGDGYLEVRTAYNQAQQPTETTYHYGFDNLVLACEADDDDPHTWQMDAQAFPKGELSESNLFHDKWCGEHPDRAMRVLTQYSFDNADAFVVLHHEKTGR